MKTGLRLKPAESLTILFLLSLVMLSLVFYKQIPRFKTLTAAYTSLLVIQVLLSRNALSFSRSRAMDGIRSVVFPVACVLVIFDSLEFLVHPINPRDIDPALIRLDYLIFRGYPTVMLESFHHPVLTDLLQVAYSTYYFLPISLGVILKSQKGDEEFDRAVFFILLCFYLSYIGYILFPALGPRYTMNHLQSSELGGMWVAEPIQSVLNSIEGIKRDAFPSGHTGVALVVLGLAYRSHRRFFFVALPAVALLIIATVYCRYHYVVDIIGGVFLTGITFCMGEKYYGCRKTRDHINR
jgi:membrane-associated phospholipid phosphatase